MKVQLVKGPDGSPNFCFGLYSEDGACLEFVQSDWDYAPLATAFGWRPCACGGTDGTVDCRHCGREVGVMLSEAYDYLSECDGEEVEWSE